MSSFGESNTKKGTGQFRTLVAALTLVFVGLICYFAFWKNCEAGYYHIIEPINGKGSYSARMEPGRYLLGFDKKHEWEISRTFWFSADETEGSPTDQSVGVRFSDGGTAKISGSVRYTIGEDEDKFIAMHIEYRNQSNFLDRAINQLVTETLTLTATLMPAEESYTTHKATFTQWALDQLNNGVYLVTTKSDTTITSDGEVRITSRAIPRRDPRTGEIMRKEYSLKDFDVHFSQFVIQDPDYETSILAQIKTKLTNLMGKVAKIAEAELAAAQEKQAKAEGEYNVVTAYYEQEVDNVVKIVEEERDKTIAETQSSQRREVAALDKKTADWQKKADILSGQGQAEYKRLLQSADSNLDIRLEMWLVSHQARAAAIANGQSPVPHTVLQQGLSTADRNLEIMGVEAARNLRKDHDDGSTP